MTIPEKKPQQFTDIRKEMVVVFSTLTLLGITAWRRGHGLSGSIDDNGAISLHYAFDPTYLASSSPTTHLQLKRSEKAGINTDNGTVY